MTGRRRDPYVICAVWLVVVGAAGLSLYTSGIMQDVCSMAIGLSSLVVDTVGASPEQCARAVLVELMLFAGRGPLVALVVVGSMELLEPVPTRWQTRAALLVPPAVMAVSLIVAMT